MESREIEELWNKYRSETNNEDAWSFKQWLIQQSLSLPPDKEVVSDEIFRILDGDKKGEWTFDCHHMENGKCKEMCGGFCKEFQNLMSQLSRLSNVKEVEETTHDKFYRSLGTAFEIWNDSFGSNKYGKVGNEEHFYFVRYEGVGKPNSNHSYESVVEKFSEFIKSKLSPSTETDKSDAVDFAEWIRKYAYWNGGVGRWELNEVLDKELIWYSTAELYQRYKSLHPSPAADTVQGYSREPTEKCEHCNGDGEIEKNILRGDEGMQIEMDVMVTCQECEGTGYQRLKPVISSTPTANGYTIQQVADAWDAAENHARDMSSHPPQYPNKQTYLASLTVPSAALTGQESDAVEFADWLKTFEPLTKENNQWVLDCQISSQELYNHYKQTK